MMAVMKLEMFSHKMIQTKELSAEFTFVRQCDSNTINGNKHENLKTENFPF